MGDRCFNCNGPASGRHTLVLETGEILDDHPMCERCHRFFDDLSSIEVVESPVLMRGGDEDAAE